MTTDEWQVGRNQTWSASDVSTQGDERIYEALRHFWHPVMYADDLDDQPAAAVSCGEQLVVCRLDGEIVAYKDLCAHRGTALSLGTVVETDGQKELRCAYHGWQYDRVGKCTVIPQRPDLVGKLRVRIQTYQAEERYGLIWVCLVDEPAAPLPEFPQYDDDSFDVLPMKTGDWKCTAPRRTENYVDLGHFAILHDGYLGQVSHPEIPAHDVWREDHVLRVKQLEPNREPMNTKFSTDLDESDVIDSEADSDGAYTMTDQEWWITMPGTVLLRQTLPGERHYCLFFHPTPLSPDTVRNFTIQARNYGEKAKMEEEVFAFSREIYKQDQPIVEAQRPEMLHRDLSYELHLQGVDTVAMQYRVWLGEYVERLVGP